MPLEIHSPSDNEINKADVKVLKSVKMTKSELELLKTDAEIQKQKAETHKCMDDVSIAKVAELRNVLTSHYIDDDKSIMGSEPFFVPMVTGKNRDIVLNKLMEIIEDF